MQVDLEQGNQNKLYEDALLGFILIDPDKMLEVSEILPSADYFRDPTNRAAYGIFLDLFNSDRFPGDPALTIKELYTGGKKQHFETMDQAARYVNSLLNAPIDTAKFNSANYRDYAEQIKWEKDRGDLRNIAVEMLAEIDRVAYDDRETFIGGVESRLGDVTMSVHGKEGLKHISEMTGEIAEQIETLRGGSPLAAGVPTGIPSLDKTLNGLKGGEVCVLAARPGVGKTTLSMQIAYNIATLPPSETDNRQHAVLIFSLEMMEAQLVSRMISTIGRVNMQQFMEEYQHFVSNDGQFYAKAYGEKFQRLMEQKLTQQYERTQIALKEIKELPIYPTTESGLSPNAIKSMVMQKKRELERKDQKLSLIVIDYLQLMVPNLGKVNASRTEEVGDMSRKMKLLAKEFDVPVLLLAQLNRNADVTERPNLKDLRESGSIEQDADKVMFIWSEHADKTINDFSEYRDDQAKREALRREQQKVLISVAKNRQGETGDCQVIFDKGFQTFVSQDDEHTSGGETFEEFALRYYQMTRTEDLFWPIRPGDVSEELEAYRHLPIPEQPYLDNNGNVITMSSASKQNTGMGIHSTVNRPRGGSESSDMFGTPSDAPVSAAASVAAAASASATGGSTTAPETDRIKPSQPPVIDDLETGFEDLPDEDDDPSGAEDARDAELAEMAAGDGGSGSDDDGTASAMALLDDVTLEDDDDALDLDELDMLSGDLLK